MCVYELIMKRVVSTGRGRFFQAPGAPAAPALGEEADGWGSFMGDKYTATGTVVCAAVREIRCVPTLLESDGGGNRG